MDLTCEELADTLARPNANGVRSAVVRAIARMAGDVGRGCRRAIVPSLVSIATLICLTSSRAFAQTGGTSGSIGGTVVDSEGRAVSGAAVVLEKAATHAPTTVTTNSKGSFGVAALQPGTYSILVSLSGFKTTKLKDVVLSPAATVSLNLTLEAGVDPVQETVAVVSMTELIIMTDTKVESRISADQISSLPLISKNALNFVTFLPGVNDGIAHIQRSSTIVGLPPSAMAVLIDGVLISDPASRSTDPFFVIIRPQTDLVDQVTVTEATPGADSSAQGAVQIKFVTRSGSNDPSGSAYEYFRHPMLNTNAFFNTPAGGKNTVPLPKNHIILNQYGFRQGGPIVFPQLFDGHGRAFYFFNYEEYRQPTSVTRTRTVINPLDMDGTFLYGCSGSAGNSSCARSVNVLSIAAANGIASTIDPTSLAMLNEIAREQALCASCLSGVKLNTDQNTGMYVFSSPNMRLEHMPGGRVDFNLSPTHRLTATYQFQKVTLDPDLNNSRDPVFPGGTVTSSQYYFRNSGSATWRASLKASVVNEAGWGFLWAPGYFSGDLDASQFASAFPEGFPNGQAFLVTLPLVSSLASSSLSQARNGSSWAVHDTVNWLRGNHSLSAGVTFSQVSFWTSTANEVPTITMGVDTINDPAATMFTSANFPGATSGELNNARNLFALLTGRVLQVVQTSARQANGTYTYGGTVVETVRQHETGMFVQDQWHARSNLTFNLGLRYELQFPVYPVASVYGANVPSDLCGQSGFGTPAGNAIQALKIGIQCNFGNPGVLNAPGQLPTYKQYASGVGGYKLDTNNLGPSLGLAWQPNVRHGFFRALLGDPALATARLSWARSFNQGGLFDYTGVFENAPGMTVDSTRNFTNGNLAIPTLLTPGLQTGALGPPATCGTVLSGCVPAKITYPAPIVFVPNGTWQLDPNYQTPYSDSYSGGIQRSINRDTSLEIRYIGTQNRHGPVFQEFGEMDIWNNPFGVSPNFVTEFKRAQQNLAINVANKLGGTFAFNGLPGQFPLPIILASFNGLAGCGTTNGCPGAANPGNYVKGANANNPWTNNTYLQALSMFTPNMKVFANVNVSTTLFGVTAFRNNGLAAGLPINFWVMNPDAFSNGVQSSLVYGHAHAMQVILTRRLSRGLQVSANYNWQLQYTSSNEGSIYRPYHLVRSAGAVPNAFKFLASWDIPVGHGERFGTNLNSWANGFIGHWQIGMTGRVENGQLVDIGDVNLVGLTLQDLQREFRYYRNPSDGFWYDLPLPLIQNTARAFSTDATTSSGYVVCTASGSNAFNCGGPDPTQPYIAPPSSANCIRLYQGVCSIRNQFITAPLFARFDFMAKKRFPFARHGSFDIEIDVLNVFNAINFNSAFPFSPSQGLLPTGQGAYQVLTAYSDIGNTVDPGGRIGQLVFRINW